MPKKTPARVERSATARPRPTGGPTRAAAEARGWLVYIVRCADGSLYTGITNDLDARIARHNSGKGAAYTRARRPVAPVYSEVATDRSAALRREAAIKRLTRMAKLALIGARCATGRTRAARRR